MLRAILLNLFSSKQHLNMFKRWCERGITLYYKTSYSHQQKKETINDRRLAISSAN